MSAPSNNSVVSFYHPYILFILSCQTMAAKQCLYSSASLNKNVHIWI